LIQERLDLIVSSENKDTFLPNFKYYYRQTAPAVEIFEFQSFGRRCFSQIEIVFCSLARTHFIIVVIGISDAYYVTGRYECFKIDETPTRGASGWKTGHNKSLKY